MTNNLIYVLDNHKKIAKRQDVYCPKCGEKQFSVFDKLYTVAFGECYSCAPDDINSENILRIAEDV